MMMEGGLQLLKKEGGDEVRRMDGDAERKKKGSGNTHDTRACTDTIKQYIYNMKVYICE